MTKLTRSLRRAWLAAGLGSVLVALAGCGEAPPSVSASNEEATLHGSVTLDNKPVSSGEIYVNPANINRPDAARRTGQIGKDGTFSLKTLVGENSVSFNLPNLPKNSSVPYERFPLDVKSGDNAHDFALESKK